MTRKLKPLLRAIGRKVAAEVARIGKAAEEEDERHAVDRADWTPVVQGVQQEIEAVARDGAEQALEALGIDDQDILDQVFDEAVSWARDRAAELVGKRWSEDGDLVDNPNADMAITDTIREEIQSAVADAIEGGDAPAELAEAIEGIAGFSAERAEMVARTEVVSAHAQGQMASMRASGVVDKKGWSTAGEDVCDECQENEDAGAIDLDDDFPSGDDAPPGHPLCRCVITAEIEESDDEDGDTSDSDEDDDSEEDEE